MGEDDGRHTKWPKSVTKNLDAIRRKRKFSVVKARKKNKIRKIETLFFNLWRLKTIKNLFYTPFVIVL